MEETRHRCWDLHEDQLGTSEQNCMEITVKPYAIDKTIIVCEKWYNGPMGGEYFVFIIKGHNIILHIIL